ncbi:di-heme oxidoredictase family protein [Xanthobacter sp. TB0139]|uniref:di-heme oxidoredictase family protein n=1 Tax=Xanthobacter sp. TB0139 TaxID=3459178 RepID=UPI00403A3684
MVAFFPSAPGVAAERPATQKPAMDGLDIAIGKALFKRAWVPAPSSTRGDDGLGPLFDARSCASCHPASGRGAARFDAQGHLEGRGVVLMIGQPNGAPDPIYGRRLQIDAIPGLKAEGIMGARDIRLPDGRIARQPQASTLAYGPLATESGLSLRVAPDLHGRGTMAAISDETLLALEAEQARTPDGVQGKARRLIQPDGSVALGRFGWKAAHTDLRHQSAEAFFLDLGMSSPVFPAPWGDCTAAQPDCRAAPHGTRTHGRMAGDDDLEIPESVLSRVVAYVASLPVPYPPPVQSAAEGHMQARGMELFVSTGCATCHRPTLPLSPDQKDGEARLFSDLLLHDMGPGLATAMEEPGITASQWRTAPLVGLSHALARHTGLLHDGRARTVAEALQWHGGEAAAARQAFEALPPTDRAALLAYVSSL